MTMNRSSQSVRSSATTTPIAAAAAMDTAASATSVLSEICVCNGRPCSSSSACAPTPIASANATSVSPSTDQSTCGTSTPPITTYDGCQRVYGACSSVT